jgi:hypothetical protein
MKIGAALVSARFLDASVAARFPAGRPMAWIQDPLAMHRDRGSAAGKEPVHACR